MNVDVVARAQKLIELAASSNEHEARNAAVRACSIIREHKLMVTDSAADPMTFIRGMGSNVDAFVEEMKAEEARIQASDFCRAMDLSALSIAELCSHAEIHQSRLAQREINRRNARERHEHAQRKRDAAYARKFLGGSPIVRAKNLCLCVGCSKPIGRGDRFSSVQGKPVHEFCLVTLLQAGSQP